MLGAADYRVILKLGIITASTPRYERPLPG